jgi:cyclic pyranopterin monophosphate synthase
VSVGYHHSSVFRGYTPSLRPFMRRSDSDPLALSHVSESGEARMVDVSEKPTTSRSARASGQIRMSRAAFIALRDNTLAKGDAMAVARIAGIQAAKQTSLLIPLCHHLPLSQVGVDVSLTESLPGVRVEATVRTSAPTGVEMEALTAVSVTLLTVYDMAKAIDKSMQITDIRLREKRGGLSGDVLLE